MATTNDERLKILQMLEDSKISAEEAATLLRALEGAKRAAPAATLANADSRSLHVHVTDLTSGTDKVNVTIPIGLVRVGLRMAERFAPKEFSEEGINIQDLAEVIASGTVGRLVEVTDMEDNERVEVYVE